MVSAVVLFIFEENKNISLNGREQKVLSKTLA